MCISTPPMPKAPPPPPEPLKDAQTNVDAATAEQKKKAALLAGLNATNPTGGAGLTTSATTAVKTLLGS